MNLDALAAHPLVGLLAIVGGVALVYRVGRALLRVGLAWAEGTAVASLMEVSVRNGDLTAMAERQAQAKTIRRRRGRALLGLAALAALLVVPPIADVARLVYAAASVLWLLPREPIRPSLPLTRSTTVAKE